MLLDGVKRNAKTKSVGISRAPEKTAISSGEFVFINKSGSDRSLRGQEIGAVAAYIAKFSHARRKRVTRTEPGKIRPHHNFGNAAYTKLHDRTLEANTTLATLVGGEGIVPTCHRSTSDSDRIELNRWAQLFFLSVAWPRAASYIPGALADSVWDDLTAQHCYGPPQTYAMLACGEYMKAISAAEGSDTVPKILVTRIAEAAAAVKFCIEQNNITKSLAFAILHLAAVEVQMGNSVASLVHQRAAGKVMSSKRLETWTAAEILHIHDNWIATPCMPVAYQIPACRNPGPWSDGQLSDSSDYVEFLRTRSLTARAVDLFVDIRELFRVREVALADRRISQTKLQAWLHLKASWIKQSLTNLHCETEELSLGIGNNQQKKGQRILTSAVTSALSWLMTSTFCGAFPNLQIYTMPPLVTILISMDTVLEGSGFTVSADLALWLHFVAWLTLDVAHGRVTQAAQNEARSRLRILTHSLGLLDGREIVGLLQYFVYSQGSMKGALQSFIASGCGLTSSMS
jgi:hypothetical protein